MVDCPRGHNYLFPGRRGGTQLFTSQSLKQLLAQVIEGSHTNFQWHAQLASILFAPREISVFSLIHTGSYDDLYYH